MLGQIHHDNGHTIEFGKPSGGHHLSERAVPLNATFPEEEGPIPHLRRKIPIMADNTDRQTRSTTRCEKAIQDHLMPRIQVRRRFIEQKNPRFLCERTGH